MDYQPIDDVIEIIIDRRGITATKLGGKWRDKGIPVISANNIRNGQFIEMDSLKYVEKELYHKWMPLKLRKGDVLLVSEGATFGELLYLQNDLDAALGQRLFALRCTDIYNKRFLYYYLKSKVGQHELYSRTTGTSVPGIRQSELRKIRVPKVDIREQDRVAETLGAIDDKILLNKEINDIFVEISQTIFKHWFVDFEFPDEEGKPYKSSGGEMIESELGKIPKGWVTISNISELCEKINYGYTKSASTEKVGLKFLRVTDINKGDWINWNDVPYCEIEDDDKRKYILEKGDIIVARMADPGKVAIFESEIPAVFASYLIRIRLRNPKFAYYLYYLMKSAYYQDFILGAASGSVQKNLNAKGLTSGLPIALPNEELADKFNAVIGNLRSKIDCNVSESEILARICDSLLPRLMSGKITVSVPKEMVKTR